MLNERGEERRERRGGREKREEVVEGREYEREGERETIWYNKSKTKYANWPPWDNDVRKRVPTTQIRALF